MACTQGRMRARRAGCVHAGQDACTHGRMCARRAGCQEGQQSAEIEPPGSSHYKIKAELTTICVTIGQLGVT